MNLKVDINAYNATISTGTFCVEITRLTPRQIDVVRNNIKKILKENIHAWHLQVGNTHITSCGNILGLYVIAEPFAQSNYEMKCTVADLQYLLTSLAKLEPYDYATARGDTGGSS